MEIETIKGQETLNVRRPGTMVILEEGDRSKEVALVTDSNTTYFIQTGAFDLVARIAGANIDTYPSFGGRLRWRENGPNEPFEKSNIDPTTLAFLPRGAKSPI